ncbi:hypothetical protein ABH927_006773 [Planotetraspora sp. GP83]
MSTIPREPAGPPAAAQFDDFDHTAGAKPRGYAEEHVVQAVLPMQQHRGRHRIGGGATHGVE